jgi:hypothetical protein
MSFGNGNGQHVIALRNMAIIAAQKMLQWTVCLETLEAGL